MATSHILDVSGDVVGAASALAGLVLVFLGATSASYKSYDPLLRVKNIRARFRWRAWFGFIGLCLALLTVALALYGKVTESITAVEIALSIFVIAIGWLLIAALFSVLDIK